MYVIMYNLGMVNYSFLETNDYKNWFSKETNKSKMQIYKRLFLIQFQGHFGDHKSVSDYEKNELKNAVWELKFSDGRRIYYAHVPEKKLLLILGGNKNGQEKDIKRAKSIYSKFKKNSDK